MGSHGVIRDSEALISRSKMIQWGGIQCLIYLSINSKVSGIISFFSKIHFKTHLSEIEVESILESIKKELESEDTKNDKNNSPKGDSETESTLFPISFKGKSN